MTRDAEHTPSPQSVVVPVEPTEAMWEAARKVWRAHERPYTFDCTKAAFRAMLAAAPAPSSLAGGDVAEAVARTEDRIGSRLMKAKDEAWNLVPQGQRAKWIEDNLASATVEVSYSDLRAILAALSPEAPAREGTAFAMNGLMTTHSTLRSANIARQNEWDQDNQISAAYRGNELAGEVGEACNVIKKLERERLGILGSRATIDELADELADVLICADLIAMHYGIDLEAAVARKFNATSEKVGLQTRLAAPNDGGGS